MNVAVDSSSGGGGGGLLFLLLPIVLLLFLVMSNRRRQRYTAEVQQALRPGVSVMTTAGLYATVVDVDDAVVHLEVAPGVVCRYSRATVARVLDDSPDTPGAEAVPDDLAALEREVRLDKPADDGKGPRP